MWNIILTFLVHVAAVVFGESPDCSQHSYYICGVDDVPEGFPATENELYQMCKVENRFLKCVIQNEEKCQTDSEYIQHHKDLLAASRDLCKRNSPSHSVIVDNLSCVKPIFDENSVGCHSSYPGSKSMKKHVQALRREGIALFSKKSKEDRTECLRRLYILACEALKVEERCGASAMEAFIDVIYTRSIPQMEFCNKKIKKFPLEIVRVIKQGELERRSVDLLEEEED